MGRLDALDRREREVTPVTKALQVRLGSREKQVPLDRKEDKETGELQV